MYQYLGKMPIEMTEECEKTYELFNDRGQILKNKKIAYIDLNQDITEARPDLNEDEINSLASFLKYILVYNPTKRPKANDILNHVFLQ